MSGTEYFGWVLIIAAASVLIVDAIGYLWARRQQSAGKPKGDNLPARASNRPSVLKYSEKSESPDEHASVTHSRR